MFRGIQMIGLLTALAAIAFVVWARRKGRVNARASAFWLLFWGLFMALDLYPSMVAYVAPALTLESNMYVLTAGAVLTLFVLVFVLYSSLSDMRRKMAKLVREQAVLENKVVKILEEINNGRKEDRDSTSST